LAGVQDDGRDEVGAEPGTESPDPGEVAAVDTCSGFDLERDDAAVVPFEYQVDFFGLSGAEMPD
jgi:hypothetical protein